MTKDTPIILQKVNKVKPTTLQLKAFNLAKAHPKWSWAKVMKEAGYDKKTTRHPGRNLIAARGFIAAQALWPSALAGRGIYMETLAAKYKKLLNAKKFTRYGKVDDNAIQLKTAESIKKDLIGPPQSGGMEEKSVTFTWKKTSP